MHTVELVLCKHSLFFLHCFNAYTQRKSPTLKHCEECKIEHFKVRNYTRYNSLCKSNLASLCVHTMTLFYIHTGTYICIKYIISVYVQ